MNTLRAEIEGAALLQQGTVRDRDSALERMRVLKEECDSRVRTETETAERCRANMAKVHGFILCDIYNGYIFDVLFIGLCLTSWPTNAGCHANITKVDAY